MLSSLVVGPGHRLAPVVGVFNGARMKTLHVDEALDRMFTCARAWACTHEEECFVVAMWARKMRDALEDAESGFYPAPEVVSTDE